MWPIIILNSSKNARFEICISQLHISGTASGHGSHNKFEDLCCTELANYILEEIKNKNVLTSSLAAKEVVARG
jgi:hypothetical protein